MPASLVGARIRIIYDPDHTVAIGKVLLYRAPALVVQVESGMVRSKGTAKVEAFTSCERIKLGVCISGEMSNRMILRPVTPLLQVPSALPLKILREETVAMLDAGEVRTNVTVVGGGASAIYFESSVAVPVVDGVRLTLTAGNASLLMQANVMTQTIADDRYAGVAEVLPMDRISAARWQRLLA